MDTKTLKNDACYFSKVKIENVACFGKAQTLNLTDKDGKPARWTVIIGDNGIGKTTLLRCLAGLSHFRKKENDTEIVLEVSTLKWNYYRGKETALVVGTFAVDCRFTDKAATCDHVDHVNRVFRSGTDMAPVLNASSYDERFDHMNFVCYGYGAARRMSASKIPTDIMEFTTRSLYDDDAVLRHAEEWLLMLDYIASKDEKNLIYKEQVEEIILNLLPDVSEIDYRLSKHVSNVIFKTPSGWVGMRQLGLGYRVMLAWMVDFAAGLFERYPDSKNPLEEPAVLLVDEIDLHLHPKWQRTIISYLTQRFPNTQFIVTAHSPLLVQAVGDANLVLLKRKGGETIIENNAASVNNWRVEQILTSDLFGLDSPHSQETRDLLDEKTRIASKRTLGPKDKLRLEVIKEKLSTMPFGDTKEEIEADFLIKKLAQKIARNKADAVR
ncbi:MAG: AAA family ATPase [bacterium]|nr:AAA family ATPase [bacterium]